MDSKLWPAVGDKIFYKGTHQFWFTNIVQDANDLLVLKKEYTIKKLELASSWCGVILEEIPEKTFALSFFRYEPKLTTQELMKDGYVFTSLKELKERGQKIDMSYTKEICVETATKIRNQFLNAGIKTKENNNMVVKLTTDQLRDLHRRLETLETSVKELQNCNFILQKDNQRLRDDITDLQDKVYSTNE